MVLTFGENRPGPYFPRLCDLGMAPTRAERRAHLQPESGRLNRADARAAAAAIVAVHTAERKLTGAVRRGLKRGKSA